MNLQIIDDSKTAKPQAMSQLKLTCLLTIDISNCRYLKIIVDMCSKAV